MRSKEELLKAFTEAIEPLKIGKKSDKEELEFEVLIDIRDALVVLIPYVRIEDSNFEEHFKLLIAGKLDKEFSFSKNEDKNNG